MAISPMLIGELERYFKWSLINVPTSKYTKKGKVTLRLGKIVHVFVLNRKYRRRTRGQFLTRDNWQGKLNKANVLFLLHDHSLMNKIRIRFDLIMWRLRFKSKLNKTKTKRIIIYLIRFFLF